MICRREWSGRVLIGACFAGVCACTTAEPAAAGDGAIAAAGAEAKAEECLPSYQEFAVGPNGSLVTDAKSGIAIRVLEGPVPPIFGYNTWKIAVLDANTLEPAPNARITWQCSYMSVHGHGTNPKSMQSLGNGEYKLVDQNLKMLGPWEVEFWVDPTGQEPEYVSTSNLLTGDACNPTSGLKGDPTHMFKVCVPRSSD